MVKQGKLASGKLKRLATNLAGLEMNTPVTTASGTFGFGLEFADFLDLNKNPSRARKRCARAVKQWWG